MSGPIDSIRQFFHSAVDTVNDVADNVRDVGNDVDRAFDDVGRALTDGKNRVVQEIDQKSGAPVLVDAAKVGLALVKHDIADGKNILTELKQRSPVDFLNWLAGPEGPRMADHTALVPGLQGAIGDVIDKSMKNPMIAGAIGKAFGFEYVPGKDFYTTNEHSTQSYLGFHTAYDKIGKLLGMDLQDRVIEFKADNGVEYKLELWKGSYGNGGAYGGEIGLYTRGGADSRGPFANVLEKIPGYYSSANGRDQIKMTQTISTPGQDNKPFTNAYEGADGGDGGHFWNLAIRTDPNVSDKDIVQTGKLELTDRSVANAMFAALQKTEGLTDVKLTDNGAKGMTIEYTWGKTDH